MNDRDTWRDNTFGPLDERIADCMAQGMSEREIAADLGLSITDAKARIDGACRRLGLTKNERDPYEGFRQRRARRVEPAPAGLHRRPGVAVGVFGAAAIAVVLVIRLWPGGGGDGATVTIVTEGFGAQSVSAAPVPPKMPPYTYAPRPAVVYYSSHVYGAAPPFAAPVDPFYAWLQAMLLDSAGTMTTTPR